MRNVPSTRSARMAGMVKTMRNAKQVKVYEVLWTTDKLGRVHEGPAGDGSHIARFVDRREALIFARSHVYVGRTATVLETMVPSKIAARWGL